MWEERRFSQAWALPSGDPVTPSLSCACLAACSPFFPSSQARSCQLAPSPVLFIIFYEFTPNWKSNFIPALIPEKQITVCFFFILNCFGYLSPLITSQGGKESHGRERMGPGPHAHWLLSTGQQGQRSRGKSEQEERAVDDGREVLQQTGAESESEFLWVPWWPSTGPGPQAKQ